MSDSVKGLLWIIGIIACIWFIFFRETNHTKGLTDYRDEWFTGTELSQVYYCGSWYSPSCPSVPYYLNVRWDGKDKASSSDEKWIHYFTIFFNNGGYISGKATCDKAAPGQLMERFCMLEHIDEFGNSYLYEIAPGKS